MVLWEDVRYGKITRCNDKPGFVVGSYLSRPVVANRLERSMCADLTACETYTIHFLLRTGFTWLPLLPEAPVGSYPTLSPFTIGSSSAKGAKPL